MHLRIFRDWMDFQQLRERPPGYSTTGFQSARCEWYGPQRGYQYMAVRGEMGGVEKRLVAAGLKDPN